MEQNIPKDVKNPYKDGYLMAENMRSLPVLPTNVTAYMKIVDKTSFKITKRIQMATQHYLLGVYSSESYQVANYGIGGQYGKDFTWYLTISDLTFVCPSMGQFVGWSHFMISRIIQYLS